jgi:hypothetical protein
MTKLRIALRNFAKEISKGKERPGNKEVNKDKMYKLRERRTKKNREEGEKNKTEIILREKI